LVVVVAAADPLSVTVAPVPPVTGLTVPEIDRVCATAVKLIPVTVGLFTVTGWLGGVKLKPLLLGVTV
jgi:hypothetical protein